MKKRLICFVMSVFMILSVSSTAVAGYIYPGNITQYEDSYKLDLFKKDNWEAVDGIKDITVRSMGSSNLIYVTSDRQSKIMSLAYINEDGLNLSAYNELVVGMVFNNAEGCTFTITYYYEGGTFTDEVVGTKGTKNIVYFMLPADNREKITRIELMVDSGTNAVDYFAIESFYADSNRTYSYADRFSSRRLTAINGNATFYDDYVEVSPDESGAHIECDLITDYEGKSALAVIEVSSTHAGILTVENISTGKVSSTALYSGTAKYSIFVTELSNKIRIGFSEGETLSNSPVKLMSVRIVPVAKDETVRYGTVESCIVEEGKIIVKGTVDSDTTIKYINSKLALYKVPYDHNGDLPENAEIEMNISTSYNIEAPVDYDHTQYKYVVALKSKHKVIPLTEPVYAMSKSSLPIVSQECHSGIHNAESTAVFESEAEDVVLDVYVNHLFASSDTVAAIRFAYRENVYYLNSDYVNEISSNIGFFTSIGGRVYLRLLSDDEGAFDFEFNEKSSVDLMCAAAAYLGSHYEKMAGIILLSGFNYNSDPDQRAKDASELIGLFASSFRNTNNSAEILAAVSEENIHIATILAAYNKRNGISNIGVVFECVNSNDSVTALKALCDSASAYGNSFRNEVIFWHVKRDTAYAEAFRKLYENAAQSSVSCVVFSVSESMTTDEICAMFEGIHGSEYVRYEFEAFKTPVDCRGEYTLWDFTQAYNTFGWLAGGSCSSPETLNSMFSETRVLKSLITPSQDSEGILVGWFEGVTDLSIADVMRVDVAVDLSAHREVPISVVLGGNGVKAEYITTAKRGEQSIYLDVNSYRDANKVEYIAIIVESNTEAVLEISKVSILSRSLADSELKTAVEQSGQYAERNSSFYIFAGAMISSTIVVFIALSKKRTTKQINGN